MFDGFFLNFSDLRMHERGSVLAAVATSNSPRVYTILSVGDWFPFGSHLRRQADRPSSAALQYRRLSFRPNWSPPHICGYPRRYLGREDQNSQAWYTSSTRRTHRLASKLFFFDLSLQCAGFSSRLVTSNQFVQLTLKTIFFVIHRRPGENYLFDRFFVLSGTRSAGLILRRRSTNWTRHTPQILTTPET